MSTRKTTAATAAAAKVENAAAATKAATTSPVEKKEMGTNASTTTTNVPGESSCSETETLVTTPTNKESPTKLEVKPQQQQQSNRITRNSPLLLASPTSSSALKKLEQRNTDAESESEDGNTKKSVQIRGRKSIKEAKENADKTEKADKLEKTVEALCTPATASPEKESKETDIKEIRDIKDTKEIKDIKDTKEIKETKETKESGVKDKEKEIKESKETKETTPTTAASTSSITTTTTTTTTTTNRLTRKSVAQELASNTRVTRNRRTSSSRPETPPVRARRLNVGKKMPVEAAAKRKRSDEDALTVEPGAKYIKIEAKDETEANEDELPPPSSGGCVQDIESLKIKQELIESDESAADPNSATAAGGSTAGQRTRGRWGARKPPQQNSPSTRATRNTKMASQSPTPTPSETKRRRVGSTNSTSSGSAITRSSTQCLAKPAAAAHHPDEDSKDSMASSSVDEPLLHDIKMEKITPDLDETDVEMEEKLMNLLSTATAPAEKLQVESSNGLSEPLIVQTDSAVVTLVVTAPTVTALVDATKIASPIATPEPSTSAAAVTSAISTSAGNSEKAASLSPELVSEGLSEISVKQFYKKPKFLENNLGIEEDPKLGEIVQKVSSSNATEKTSNETTKADIEKQAAKEDTADEKTLIIFEDAVKEGLDDSGDDKKSITQDDDITSLSTGNLSPLVVDEEDEEEEIAAVNKEPIKAVDNNKPIEAQVTVIEVTTELDDEAEEEDDVTVEESETISMDNNASLHEDALPEDETREEMTTMDDIVDELELELQHTETNDGEELKICEEKTKDEIVCDNKQAKLEVKVELMGEAVLAVKTEDKLKSNEKQVDAKQEVLPELVVQKEEIKEAKKEEQKNEVKEPKSLVIEEKLERLEDDAVLAKIDAELKKIGEKVEEKQAVDVKATKVVELAKMEEKDKPEKVADNKVKTPVEPMEVDESMSIETEEKPDDKKDVALITAEKEEVKEEENKTAEEMVAKTLIDNQKVWTPESSATSSPAKANNNLKEDDAASLKSDTNSWITLDLESEAETQTRKEDHFKTLGLLTHEEAEKQRQKCIQSSAAAVQASRVSQQHQLPTKRNGKAAQSAAAAAASSSSSSSSTAHEYTGTLKTVIKLNRGHNAAGSNGNGRKQNSKDASNGGNMRRQSLKMTFQKGRGRGQGNADRATDQHNHGEDAYYTIQNENEGALKTSNNSTTSATNTGNEHTNVQTHGRKSYNRSNNTSHTYNTTNSAIIDSSHSESGHHHHHHDGHSHGTSKKDEKEEILIPEKASSFKFHPGRLCDDQCFYCSGKFGLYDTPCHVGQIKSSERQQKILENEEKLTVDSCLCDACFRHVDRRANVPSYKKRLSAPGYLESGASTSAAAANRAHNATADGHNLEDGDEDGTAHKCLVPDCANPALHSLRRKCIRKSVKKFLHNFDMPPGSACVWLCQAHYDTVIQCSGCVLCKRRLGKNHMYHITSDTDRLEKALSEMGIPVQLGIGTAVCKLCRYFANLLMKPPDSTKSQKAEFVKNYRKRLLQFHNIHDGSNDVSEDDAATAATDKSTFSGSKTPQKKDKKATSAASANKQVPSPAGSSGSSVECLGMPGVAATASTSAAAAAKATAELKQQHSLSLENSDILADYDVPMVSTDSNSSSAGPTSPKQMSKLQAILQNATGNNSASAAASVGSAKKAAGTRCSSSSSASSCSGASADISNVLRSNPNISMRELFPGEEDLGLHFKAPFGSAASQQRTPEGWTRVQTFLQYDDPTRCLWEELQKPYGNQSSFLRHLLLLEKYFRNGDLTLAAHACSNANVYTQTVRRRLTSFDQGHCGGLQSAKPSQGAPAAGTSAKEAKDAVKDIPTVEINEDDDDDEEDSVEAASLIKKATRSRSVSVDKLTKQLSTNAVTIIARPKQSLDANSPQKSLLKDKDTSVSATGGSGSNLAAASAAAAAVLASASNSNSALSASASNSRSILKSNLLGINKSVEILPISAATSSSASSLSMNKPLINLGGSGSVATESKQQKILDVANKLLVNQMEAAQVLKNANAGNNSASGATSLLNSPPELVSLQRRAAAAASNNSAATTVTNPSASTPTAPAVSATMSSTTASLINNKRPHLLPKANVNRNVPANVVVLPDTLTPQERQQSKSWRPTLMPVEENQHLLNKGGPLYQTADGRRLPALVQVQSGGKPFLISIFDYNRMCILRREKLLRDQMLKATKNRHEMKQQQQQQQQQQHQQQQMQKAASAANQQQNLHTNINKQQQQQHQQQTAKQQMLQLQMLQFQKHHQQHQQQQHAAMKAVAAAASARFQPIAPKPSATIPHPATSNAPNTSSAASSVINNFPAPMMPMLTNAITNAAGNANAAALQNNTSWLWNNFPESNQLLLNGSLAQQQAAKLPHLLHKPTVGGSTATITSKQQQQQQQAQAVQQALFDNMIMSKIPRSLTVIPQHKLMNAVASASNNNNGGAGTSSGHKE